MASPLSAGTLVAARTALADRAVPLAVTAVTGLLAVGAWFAGAPPIVCIAVTLAPLVLLFGYRLALVGVVAILVVRVLVDAQGNLTLTAGLAVALIGLGVLVAVRSPGWPAVFVVATGYLAVSAASGAGTYGASGTFGEAIRVISLVAVVAITLNAPGRLTLGRATLALQLIGLVPALIAIVQLATGTGTYIDGAVRATGGLAQANSAAALFAVCSIVTFARLFGGESRVRDSAAMLLFVGALVATGSIGGFATAVAGMVVYLTVDAGRRVDRILLGGAALVIAVATAVNSRIGAERISEYSSGVQDTSLGWRFEAWGKVAGAWRQHPLFGNGIGASSSGNFVLETIPHNEYLRLLAELGVFGLVVVLALVGFFAAGIRRRLRAGAPRAACALASGVLAALLVNGLAANTMLYTVASSSALFVLSACWRLIREVPR